MYITIIELVPIIKVIRKIAENGFIVINKSTVIDGSLSFPVFLREIMKQNQGSIN